MEVEYHTIHYIGGTKMVKFNEFGLSRSDARDVLLAWMQSFEGEE